MQANRKLLRTGIRAAWCLLSVVLVGAGSYLLFTAEFLKIKHITITGCSSMQKEEVLRMAGIHEGRNILTLDLSEATEMLESDPWIYMAVIKRTLPDTIDIAIEQRIARANIQLDELYCVDNHGHIFIQTGEAQQHLPLLTGLSLDDVENTQEDAARVMRAALTLIDALEKETTHGSGAVKITLDKIFGLTMTPAGSDATVFLGFDEFEQKLSFLRKIQDDLSRKGLAARTIHLGSVKQAYITVQTETREPSRPSGQASIKKIT